MFHSFGKMHQHEPLTLNHFPEGHAAAETAQILRLFSATLRPASVTSSSHHFYANQNQLQHCQLIWCNITARKRKNRFRLRRYGFWEVREGIHAADLILSPWSAKTREKQKGNNFNHERHERQLTFNVSNDR